MHKNDQAIRKAMQLAQTEEGQKLVTILKQIGGTDLTHAAEKAAAGDYSQIQQTISRLMENPEARKLLEQMGW